MSYRTYVNGHQIFGNNEWYQEWADFIESEGIKIDEDGLYDGYIDNLQGVFDVIDKITRRLINERHKQVEKGETFFGKPCKELADLTDLIIEDKNILLSNIYMIEHAYCFLPYQAYKAVEDIIERCEHDESGAVRLGFSCYRLKDDKRIHVEST
jgi:hypothetical protein